MEGKVADAQAEKRMGQEQRVAPKTLLLVAAQVRTAEK